MTARLPIDRPLKLPSCPHCGHGLKVRTSREDTILSRELILVCAFDDGCAAKFGGQLEITHQIAPSARPREGLKLRETPPRRRTVNDNHLPKRDARGPEVSPPPANDTAPVDASTG